MSAATPDRTDRLFDLLPLVHRMRDAADDDNLRDLLRVIAEQVNVVEDDIGGLYDNWFVETADDWVTPYIGDLVGWTPVDPAGALAAGVSGRDLARDAALVPRQDVANTVRHRRRKGTRALLEVLARDVAGWPGRAVEFYRLLWLFQHVNYLELARGRTTDVRDLVALESLGTPFEALAHTVDVRRISSVRTQGLHNIPSVGLFVWRLRSYSVTGTPACQVERVGRWAFTFNALGFDGPLFTAPAEGDRRDHPAGPFDVPGPIGRKRFEAIGDARPRLVSPDAYGEGRSVAIWAADWPVPGAGGLIPAEKVIPADLSDWDHYRPKSGTVAADPVLGRLIFPRRDPPTEVTVAYRYGFSADLGGGEYERPLPELPASVSHRFRDDDVTDPLALLTQARDRSNPTATLVARRWPPEGAARLAAYQGEDPPDSVLLGDLVEALNAALEDAALYQLGYPGQPTPEGTALVVANRLYLEQTWPAAIKPARWYRRVEGAEALEKALRDWGADQPRYAVIELDDSGVYSVAIEVELLERQALTIRAGQRRRPIIWLADRRPDKPDSFSAVLHPGSRLTLDGLTVAGRAVHLAGPSPPPPSGAAPAGATEDEGCVSPTRVVIRHCTLVPGWLPLAGCDPQSPAPPSLELADLDDARLDISHSIVGSIQVVAGRHEGDPLRLAVSDSILDATAPELEAIGGAGPGAAYVALTIARVTVFGAIDVHALELGENTIFEGTIKVARRSRGCLRFSSVVPGSRTPRRFHCQPDLAVDALGPGPSAAAKAEAELGARPRFTSTSYPDPGYAQLSCRCPDTIRRGADDESEMGAFHDLYQPLREAALSARADEYTPAGLDVAVVPVT